MYKTDLINAMFEKSQAKGRPIYPNKTAAAEALEDILGIISGELESGGTVQLTGFGTFSVKETKERQGSNPSTHEKITIPAGRKVKFKPGTALAEMVGE